MLNDADVVAESCTESSPLEVAIACEVFFLLATPP